MAISESSFRAACQLFVELNCNSSGGIRLDFRSDAAIVFLDVEKMKCHIVNCLAALNIIEIKKAETKALADGELELVKTKVFAGACSILIHSEFDNNKSIIKDMILSAFPDKTKMSNAQSWLPLHFAIVLLSEGKLSEGDVQTLYSIDPLAMHRLSSIRNDGEGNLDALTGCTPAHLLCMQKQPSMTLVRYFCLRDPKAFLLCDQKGRSVLHLLAMHSESLGLLQTMLEIDHKMARMRIPNLPITNEAIALGLLCKRLEFPSFKEMVSSLIEVDNSVEVIFDGMTGSILSHEASSFQNLLPGSRGERLLNLLEVLLNANPEVARYDSSLILHRACAYLTGELGVVVVKLLLSKNSEGIRCFYSNSGRLPIQHAVDVDVLTLLHKAYPESISIVTHLKGFNLLHLTLEDNCSLPSTINPANKSARLTYLYDQCPQLVHAKNNYGFTPLHRVLWLNSQKLDMKAVKFLCDADETIVRGKCTPSNINDTNFESLPLHLLVKHRSKFLNSELSDEADCFRLLLRIYPASAGIRDGHLKSPYDLAVSEHLSDYFIRILLAADPTIDQIKRKNLNFKARREGMFLAFRALPGKVQPTIWSKIRYEGIELLAYVMSYL
jgi:hypothetical protein